MALTYRLSTIILGRTIGTHTEAENFDNAEDLAYCTTFYEFEPNPDASSAGIPSGALTANFDEGTFETYNDDGSIDSSIDMVDALSLIGRAS
jgi:hypothetical protein